MVDVLEPVLEAARNEARRIEEDCTYSSKGHFNASDTWLIRHYWIGIPATLLGAAAGAAIVKNYADLAALFSLGGTILAGLMTFLKPTERASSHKAAGDQYLSLRNDTRIFSDLLLLQMTEVSAILQGISSLSKRRDALNKASPIVPRGAFEKARVGIEQGEATHHIGNGSSKCL